MWVKWFIAMEILILLGGFSDLAAYFGDASSMMFYIS